MGLMAFLREGGKSVTATALASIAGVTLLVALLHKCFVHRANTGGLHRPQGTLKHLQIISDGKDEAGMASCA